jgi:hypothetical protein
MLEIIDKRDDELSEVGWIILENTRLKSPKAGNQARFNNYDTDGSESPHRWSTIQLVPTIAPRDIF